LSFKITILGSGAALPTFKRNPTAQYIECNNRHILIDCGEGTQLQLRKYNVKLQRISFILISHLHGDHFFGLVGLLSTMHLLGRDKGIVIYGPEGLEQIIKSQLEIGGHKLEFGIQFIVLDGKTPKLLYEDRVLEIHTFPLKHRIPTNGFLIREKEKDRSLLGELFKEDGLSLTYIPLFKKGLNATGENGEIYYYEDYTLPPKPTRSYAYCSDTKYYENVIPFIEGVDLLYHEATFTEIYKTRAKTTFHSTAIDAAKIAHKAKVKKLIIGHISSRYEDGKQHQTEASSVFENVSVVEDGDIYEILF
jgi:ribonuclease Z